jgi:iron-sulfur cluster assembly protein
MAKQLLTFTPRAVDRLKEVAHMGLLKVGVKKGGCAGMEYTFEKTDAPAKFDSLVESDGVSLVIDAKAVLYLIGAEMDYKSDKFSSSFVFTNPNQTSACGCGESVELKAHAPV